MRGDGALPPSTNAPNNAPPGARYKCRNLSVDGVATILAVSRRRACTISSCARTYLRLRTTSSTLEAQRTIVRQVRSARTRQGTPIAPTTTMSLLTAIPVAIQLVEQRVHRTFELRRAIRATKMEIALHIKKQALPLTLPHIRSIASDTTVHAKVRKAIIAAWVIALRYSDLGKVQRKDVSLIHQRRRWLLKVRLRGVKGAQLGKPAHVRFVPLKGISRTLKFFGEGDPNERIWQVPVARFKAALRKQNKQYSLHSPRRGAALFLANHGVSVTAISHHLGHSSVETTRHYIDPSPQQVECRCQIRRAMLLITGKHLHNCGNH